MTNRLRYVGGKRKVFVKIIIIKQKKNRHTNEIKTNKHYYVINKDYVLFSNSALSVWNDSAYRLIIIYFRRKAVKNAKEYEKIKNIIN